MVSKTSPIIKLLKLMDGVYELEEGKQKGRGRPKVYDQSVP